MRALAIRLSATFLGFLLGVSVLDAQDSRGIPDPLRRLLAEGSYVELRGLIATALNGSLSESDRQEYLILLAETELAAGQTNKAREFAHRAQDNASRQNQPDGAQGPRLQLLKARIDRTDQKPLEAALELQRLLLGSQDLQCKFEAA